MAYFESFLLFKNYFKQYVFLGIVCGLVDILLKHEKNQHLKVTAQHHSTYWIQRPF